jgi:hypothetical protein
MKKLLFLTLISIFFVSFGCRKDKSTSTARVINKTKFAEILADIHIADAAVMFMNKHQDTNRQYIADYYHVIFVKYHVTREDFLISMDYYTRNPDKFDQIYESVNEILNTKKGKKW